MDSLTTVRKLKDKGVEVYFEKENIFTLDFKGEPLITIMSSLAQEESRSISENTTWGQRKRFADGIMSLGYSNFLGYKKGANPGDMEIVEEEAVIVCRIYDEYLAGKSPGEIANRLTADGIPTPARVESPSPAMVAYREKYNHPAAARQMICSDIKIPMAYPKKAFVRAWNQLVSKKTRYQPILQRTADTTDNALTRLRAREMIRNNSNNQQEVSRMVVRGF